MSTERSVLIIDDDEALRLTLAEQLSEEGEYSVVGAGTLEDADRQLRSDTAHFDVVILDVSMPDGDGRDFCAKLRKTGHKMPIIMLTGSDHEADVVRGLEAGANDYLAKPFRLQELLARVRTQLRSFENSEDAVFVIGPYVFHPAAKVLRHSGKNLRIHLTSKEVTLLKFLYRAGNRAVRREELLDEVWGYNAVVRTHTLETHIYRLRQKIEPNPLDPCLLISCRSGYRLDREGAAARG